MAYRSAVVDMATTRHGNAGYGSRDDERRLFAPCRATCPVHVDVPAYLSAIAEGRFTDALEIVLERNPLASVCGRVCLRPCEEDCRRCMLDEPVAIAQLKRAAADFGVYPMPRKPPVRPQRVAIIGGGPAGLTAARDLALFGYQVTVYEEQPRLGGMLRYGIPNYRLPDYALDKDIEYILSCGVEAVTGVHVGRDILLGELAETNDAVLVTAGLQGSRALPIEGADLPGVLTALPFLAAAARGERVDVGPRVVVVGGGNVAVDVARTAVRQGAKHVAAVCLESAEEMPASEHEMEEARLEGVRIYCSWGPRRITGDGAASGLEAVRCTSVFDSEKRFSPRYDESVVEVFPAETVIFAIGQSSDVSDLGMELTARGSPVVDPVTCATPTAGVYAAGDVVSGPTKIIDAVAAGRRAAAVIVRDLSGNEYPLRELEEESAVLGEVPDTMASKLITRRRIRMERLEFFEAVGNFSEIEFGYTEYEAAREAQRCLQCTTGARLTREKCVSCLSCLRICPHGAPRIKVGGYVYFDAEACHACGACASQCPAQAIAIEGYSEDELTRRVEALIAGHGIETTVMFACGGAPILPKIAGADVRTLRATCLLRVSERNALETLRLGATSIVFAGCVEATCQYPHARALVAQRIAYIKAALTEIGMADSMIVVHEVDEEEMTHLI
jgi:NADPH-dependent glutamate synthase beta subunit-like oxidoreductase